MRGNDFPQKRMIGIDQNTTKNTFVRDEQDLQDATPHRNPVHPVNPVKIIDEC